MSQNIHWTLMGKPVDGVEWPIMVEFWSVAAIHVHRMVRPCRDRII